MQGQDCIFCTPVGSLTSVVTVNASVLLCITFLVFCETDKEEQQNAGTEFTEHQFQMCKWKVSPHLTGVFFLFFSVIPVDTTKLCLE